MDFGALVLGPCIAAFGVPVVYQTVTGVLLSALADGSPLMGIFESATKEMRTARDGTWVDTARPTLGMRVCDLVSAGCDPNALPIAGELMTIAGKIWRISESPPPDSEGHLHIILMVTS